MVSNAIILWFLKVNKPTMPVTFPVCSLRMCSRIFMPWGSLESSPSTLQGQPSYKGVRPSLWGKPKGSKKLQENLVSMSKNNLVWECFPFLWNVMKWRHTYTEYKSVAKTPLAAKTMTLQKNLLVCPDSLRREKWNCRARGDRRDH